MIGDVKDGFRGRRVAGFKTIRCSEENAGWMMGVRNAPPIDPVISATIGFLTPHSFHRYLQSFVIPAGAHDTMCQPPGGCQSFLKRRRVNVASGGHREVAESGNDDAEFHFFSSAPASSSGPYSSSPTRNSRRTTARLVMPSRWARARNCWPVRKSTSMSSRSGRPGHERASSRPLEASSADFAVRRFFRHRLFFGGDLPSSVASVVAGFSTVTAEVSAGGGELFAAQKSSCVVSGALFAGFMCQFFVLRAWNTCLPHDNSLSEVFLKNRGGT